MKGVNKKTRLIVVALILIECFSIFLTYKSFENKKINEDIKKYMFDKNTFAIFVENDGNYEEAKDTSLGWPDTTYSYRFNEEKSYCVNSNDEEVPGILSFDNERQEAKVITKQTVFCYLYFDERVDIKINVSDNNILNKIGYYKNISCNGTADAKWDKKYNSLLINSISSKEVECDLKTNYSSPLTGTRLTEKVVNDVNILIDEFKNKYDHDWVYDEEFGYLRSVFGYRYFNVHHFIEPNNYIWFNNELWRIIGSIKTKKSNDAEVNLVKIIRNNSIGNYQYDNSQNSGSTPWGNSYLYKLLNGAYLNSSNGNIDGTDICSYYKNETSWEYKSSCNFEKTGLNNNPMIQEVYWNVGRTTPSAEVKESFNNEKADTSIKGHVGLISPSDYGLILWPNAPIWGDINLNRICAAGGANSLEGSKKVWLYSQMTEPSINNTATGLNTLNIKGCIKEFNSGTTSHLEDIPTAVRPVVFLKENVFTYAGDGSIDNPYQIAMN